MKKLIIISLLLYYTIGTFCLPMGDFSILPSLPKMYQHCKVTEDRDMTLLDFVTDHLIPIDGILDSHENGDDQKPHQPFHYTDLTIQLFTPTILEFKITARLLGISNKKTVIITTDDNFTSDYTARKFRPPIF